MSAVGAPPLAYQWSLNGSPLPDATNATLVVTNVTQQNAGDYVVRVSNPFGAVTSQVATLELLIRPTIVEPPQPVTAVVGESATFSVTVTNTATLPVYYQWRKASVVLTNIVLNARTCRFTLCNVQTNVTTTNGPGNYRVIVTNAASVSPLASPLVALTVIPASPPVVTTLAASSVTPEAAEPHALVNPLGATTRAWFEYGLSTAYDRSTSPVNLAIAPIRCRWTPP